ncbi:MAG: ABC-type phosphate transport system substrate-binding protein [Oleiphilaceae bacterium]|jgi:ABC-type phosphate transport system substrate-binding protein
MKNIIIIVLLSVLTVFISISKQAKAEEIAIITNIANNIEITDVELKQIFLGKATVYSNGQDAKPFALDKNDALTKIFNKEILKKRPAQFKAYWSKMIFTGIAVPPQSYKTSEEVINQVKASKESIGYIDAKFVDDSVKVIKVVK